MKNPLLEKFKTIKPRDRSGAVAVQRFDYQTHYAIHRIIELLRQDRPFVITFDYYDDLLTMDSLEDPTWLEFIQVKTKSRGNWTVSSISKEVGRAAPKSIVSRMYELVHIFGSGGVKSLLVSNTLFDIKQPDGKKRAFHRFEFSGTAAHDDEIAALNTAVKKDFREPLLPDWHQHIRLENCPIGLDDQVHSAKGRLVSYLEETSGGASSAVSPLYETLYRSITSKTGNCIEQTDNLKMMKERSLSHPELKALFSGSITRSISFVENWDTIANEFSRSGIGTLHQIRLRVAAVEYYALRMTGRADVAALSEVIRAACKDNAAGLDACEHIQDAANMIRAKALSELEGFAPLEIEAALLVEIYEAINAPTEKHATKTPSSQPEGKRQ